MAEHTGLVLGEQGQSLYTRFSGVLESIAKLMEEWYCPIIAETYAKNKSIEDVFKLLDEKLYPDIEEFILEQLVKEGVGNIRIWGYSPGYSDTEAHLYVWLISEGADWSDLMIAIHFNVARFKLGTRPFCKVVVHYGETKEEHLFYNPF